MIEPAAVERWPDEFGGLWRLPEADVETVRVAFTESAEEKVAELREALPLDGIQLEPVTVARSLADLRAEQAKMMEDRDRVHDGELSLTDVPETYDLDIDIRHNRVLVIVDQEVDAAAAEATLVDRYGVDIVVDPIGTAVFESCTRTDCGTDLRSGLQAVGLGVPCSTAFTVKRPSGARRILSAGHCHGAENANRYHAGEKYGEVKAQQISGRVDAERHFVKSGWTARKWIYVANPLKDQEVKSRSSWAGLAVGSAVCMSGVTSGKQCGFVLSKDHSPDPDLIPGGNRFVRTDYCATFGDSGAGVYRQFGHDKVHGIHSLGAGVECEDPGHYSVFGHIEYALDALDVTLATVP